MIDEKIILMNTLERDRKFFILATVLMGLGACVNASVFNNYLKDVFSLNIAQRTFLEFPREIPGFLVSILIGILALFGEVRIALIANLAASAGMLALGWIPSSFILMVSSVFLYSAGQHLYMPLGNVIGITYAEKGKEGGFLGRIQSLNTVALVGGAAILLALFWLLGIGYKAAFSAGALAYLGAALAFLAMKPLKRQSMTRGLVFRKAYLRYYILSILYGGRKQLFITFGPWLLVDYFKQPVQNMTLLFLLSSVLGIFAQPIIGKLTDKKGTRKVLGAEALLIVIVCLFYGFSPELLPFGVALVVVGICYMLDQSANAVSLTRAVYVKNMVTNPAHLSPTLSLGITIDHIISMSIPSVGGLLWRFGGDRGYRWVFLGGAVIGLLNYFVTRGMPKEKT